MEIWSNLNCGADALQRYTKQRGRRREEEKGENTEKKTKDKEEDRSRSPLCSSQLKKLKRGTRVTQQYRKFQDF
ncbi:hypothetical protein VNO78_28197 [Psophocarpus tetragonolobus]|uniref:Uncharacterized protein n=1 Tax=Psophocarpus tetragonolobus TaxID=3891 RepID=A0AAN9S2E0_PSOTE